VMAGLAFLAASPGAPLTTKRSQMAGARFRYSYHFSLFLAGILPPLAPNPPMSGGRGVGGKGGWGVRAINHLCHYL
jgi:hypothetical protein